MLHTSLRSTAAGRLAGRLVLFALAGLPCGARADIAPPPINRGDPLAAAPAPAGAQVTGGSIDKEVIRRVIRRHVNEIRFCYEKQLARNPSLAGTVSVSFRISTTGAVDKSEVKSSTLNNPDVESCIATRVLNWVFPAPIGGPVGVTYPFVLRSAADPMGGSPSSPAPAAPGTDPAKPPAEPPAEAAPGSPTYFSFSAYPGARLLCHEHVRGAGPRPMEIEWYLFASPDPLAKVVGKYETETGRRAISDGERAGVGLTSARNARDKMSIYPSDKAAGYPGCASKARAGERTLILISRGIGG